MAIAIGFGGAGALFGILALFYPSVLSPLNRVWMAFGALLHRIVNPIVMGVIYFLVFTPMGLLMRIFGFDPLRVKSGHGPGSYWIKRDDAGPAPETMTKQF